MTLSRILPAKSGDTADVQQWQLPQFGRDIDISALTGSRPNITSAGNNAAEASTNTDNHDTAVDQGYNDGLQLAARQSEEKLLQLDELITALGKPALSLSDQVMSELLNLAQEMARQILQRELSLSADEMPKLLEAAIAQMPRGSEATIVSVNTRTAEALQQHLPQAADSEVKLSINDSLNDNNFTLKKGRSIVHGGIDAMLDRVASQFSESV